MNHKDILIKLVDNLNSNSLTKETTKFTITTTDTEVDGILCVRGLTFRHTYIKSKNENLIFEQIHEIVCKDLLDQFYTKTDYIFDQIKKEIGL